MSRNLYAEITVYLNATRPDRRGWTHVDCPFCGAEADPHQPNFSFNQKGWHCYGLCKVGGNLKDLAIKLGLWTDNPAERPSVPLAAQRPIAEPVVAPEPSWKASAEAIVEGYLHHPNRYKLWQAYKNVSKATIDKHNFGVGQLPDQKMTRLIVPLYWRGEIVGLKGRQLADAPKTNLPSWIAATGSTVDTLWGFNHVPPNPEQLWICENYVDAALVSQEAGQPCVAAGGARTLTDHEVAALRRIAPRCIIMAYDNDLAGQAGPKLRAELEAQWRAKHPEAPASSTPRSGAFASAEKLRQAGIRVEFYPWPEDAPPKADLFWALQQQLAV